MQQSVAGSGGGHPPGASHPLLPLAFPGSGLHGPGLPGGPRAELPFHPAFLHPHYLHPSLLALRHPFHGDKGKSFTIDAILGGGARRDERAGTENRSPGGTEGPQDLRVRRERSDSGGHPYQMPCPTALRYSQIHSITHNKDRMHERKSSVGGTGSWKQSKSKRVRTIFTPEQLERMEAEFERQQYMVGTERYYLAASLNLTEAQVKVWFQNRRIKWRKQNLEQQHAKLANLELFTTETRNVSDAESDASGLTPPPPGSHLSEDLQETNSPERLALAQSDIENSFMSAHSPGELQICERHDNGPEDGSREDGAREEGPREEGSRECSPPHSDDGDSVQEVSY